ncbi:MAG: alpha/beta fold hydrolase [Janthinobacterium lividum]
MADKIPMVLIPALLCDEALYAEVLAGLEDKVAAQVMMSPHPTLAESVADILARAPERFVLCGTSYGARLAIEVALAAPGRMRGLWLMGANPGAPDREQALGMAGMVEDRTEDAIAMLAGLVVAPQHAAARATFEAMARRVGGRDGGAQMRAVAAGEDVWERLGTLHVPALVVWGKDDALVPVATGRRLSDALPHAHYFALDGCGHLPTIEKPDEVTEIVEEWLGYDVDEAHAH